MAAQVGGISNTTWGTFERSGEITPGVHRAVMQAFGWPVDWDVNLPPAPARQPDDVAELRSEIQGLRAQLAEVLELTTALVVELRQRDGGPRSPARTAPKPRRAAGE